MTIFPLHPWHLTPEEATRVQAELRKRLLLTWDGRSVTTIAGVDVGIKGERAYAAIVIFRYPHLQPIEAAIGEAPLVFPYIPGLLAFREGPAVLAAWERLHTKPDVLMFDGQGIAHPRGIGIASQMGLWLERPSIGVAKSRLYGYYRPPGEQAGDESPLYDENDRQNLIGAVLRTRQGGNPLYISPGHLIDVPQSVIFVRHCCTGYRLPEPTRWAHKVAAGEELPSQAGHQATLFDL